MKWIELCIHTTTEAVEPVSNVLHEFDADGVSIEDPLELTKERNSIYGEIYELNPDEYPVEGVLIKAYYSEASMNEEKVQAIKSAIDHLKTFDIDLGKNVITIGNIDEESWATAWKQYYKPLKMSKRVTVVPMWEDYNSKHEDEIVVKMDPGMAFGTGTHPTTILSVQALDSYVQANSEVIDVGCGSGILSATSILLGARHVLALDVDDVAISSTMANAQLNEAESKIDARENDLLNGVTGPVDIVVSNILAEIILKFVKDAYKVLKSGGIFITSGIIQSKADAVRQELEDNGFRILETNQLEDWVAYVAKKI